MWVLAPLVVSVVVAAFSGEVDPSPSNLDLEGALRGTAGIRYGEDSVEAEPETAYKPHEMLLRMDVESVPDDLLLGILLAGATFGDPVEVARRLVAGASHDVTRLREPSLWERTKGVGAVGHARVVAAMELARRIDVRSSFSRRIVVTTPSEAVRALSTMSFGPDEILAALFLDRRRRLIGGRTITVGSDGFTVVDPRQIYKMAMEMGASAILLAHNHPSGDATPSQQDRDVTDRVARAGRVIGIPLLDHLVLGSEGRWSSLAQEGHLPPWEAPGPSWTAEGSG